MVFAGRLNKPRAAKAGPTPPFRVENRIGVQAPPEVVWELLSDLSAWPRWNPIYPEAGGTLKIGGRLKLTLALPGEAERQIRPRILDWVPNEQILWADVVWRGWGKTIRFIEIEELDKTACLLSNGEVFTGLFAEMYGQRHRRALKKGFAAMSEALKLHAETLWRDRGGGAS